MLLERRGCTVTKTSNARRVKELVARNRVDVVLVDAGRVLTAAAQIVATVEALAPQVGVVLVADDANGGLRHLPVLAKWGPFDHIFAAVEQAGRVHERRSWLVG